MRALSLSCHIFSQGFLFFSPFFLSFFLLFYSISSISCFGLKEKSKRGKNDDERDFNKENLISFFSNDVRPTATNIIRANKVCTNKETPSFFGAFRNPSKLNKRIYFSDGQQS